MKVVFQRFISTTRWSKSLFVVIVSLGILGLTNNAWSEGEHLNAINSLAKQSQNPISMLSKLSFENNATLNNGPDDDLINILKGILKICHHNPNDIFGGSMPQTQC